MKTIHFPRWAEVLGASDLPQRERESCQVTLRWYLSWCHRLGVGGSVPSAQDFMTGREKRSRRMSGWWSVGVSLFGGSL
jgi:hypothetical protein